MAAAIALPSPLLRLSSSSSSSCLPRLGCRVHILTRTRPTRFPRMIFNGAPARSARIAGKIYRRLDSCLVVPPPAGRNHLMELLAKEGFLIVSVPYNVTFDHTGASREVYERFHNCMEVLLNTGIPDANLSASDLINLPLYSVGHSNGALLQLLVRSYYSERIPEANVVVSFNNRPASEAVPYFEQFGPVVSQVMPIVEANPMYSLARNASGNAWKVLLDTAGTLIQEYDEEAITSLNKFVDQLPSVMNQVTQGTSEFKLTPSENRVFFKMAYNVPCTLLVKFSTDAIDETDLLENILRPRVESIGGTLERVTLPRNHLTPCIQVFFFDRKQTKRITLSSSD